MNLIKIKKLEGALPHSPPPPPACMFSGGYAPKTGVFPQSPIKSFRSLYGLTRSSTSA